jgi:hypothetical protein
MDSLDILPLARISGVRAVQIALIEKLKKAELY